MMRILCRPGPRRGMALHQPGYRGQPGSALPGQMPRTRHERADADRHRGV